MICPACSEESRVSETRRSQAGVRRRRACACGARFTTLEVIVPNNPNFRGELRLISTIELTRIKQAIDRLTLTDRAWVVQADLDE